jgi:tyrosinase
MKGTKRYRYLFRDNVVPKKVGRKAFLGNLRAIALTTYVRQNQRDTTAEFRSSFRSAIEQLVESGRYSDLVNIHADMTHRMHTMRGMDSMGSLRFLPWHRAYLHKLEVELQIIDPQLFIPYWDWTVDQAIPDWLTDFLPEGVIDLNGNPIVVTRNPGADEPSLPSPDEIAQVQQNTTYLDYTLALEGAQPYGAHNQVHVWVGGTMAVVPTAPADPIFWLHHAFIDKLWHDWQAQHPDQHPELSGSSAVLDPWADTVTEVESTTAMGYDYT